jgi:hypothetical protein
LGFLNVPPVIDPAQFLQAIVIVLFEAYSAFTHVTACTLALSPYFVTSFTQRLQTFRHLHACSGCFRLEQFAGWGFHPLGNAALSRRTPSADVQATKWRRR